MSHEREKRHRIAPRATQHARKFRKDSPVPERILWGMLRNRQMAGLKFRRQVSIGPYFADFYCADAMLVVELDGESHFGREEHDVTRDQHMADRGHKVLRITNDDLLQHTEAVYDEIERIAQQHIEELDSQRTIE